MTLNGYRSHEARARLKPAKAATDAAVLTRRRRDLIISAEEVCSRSLKMHHNPRHTENSIPAAIINKSVISKRGFWYHGGTAKKPDETSGRSGRGIW